MDTILLICLSIIVLILSFAIWIGVFKEVTIKEELFHGGTFIYKDIKCHISQIGQAFNSMFRDQEKYKEHQVRKFTFPALGIYYDDPHNLVDPTQNRSSVGFLVQYKDDKVVEFYQNLGYKIKVLPQTKSIYGDFPCKLRLSCMIGAQKFYPASLKYMGQNKERLGSQMNELSGSAELIQDGKIKYYFPLENKKDFYLTPDPRPEQKNLYKYKDQIEKSSKKNQ
ncbi:UNKNOWN [Stylonychia lemnae]|uniref:Uncharacterized protein n=1 Tax=Stylonychia lemnae TaxID=5949 RepID=A0A078B9J7_STYLE|nr:UNKNOWN [Stylonychia lemnae]|eukprot:CDW90238.1 UNKNOWN [Stylonychia lemnae]